MNRYHHHHTGRKIYLNTRNTMRTSGGVYVWRDYIKNFHRRNSARCANTVYHNYIALAQAAPASRAQKEKKTVRLSVFYQRN